jgi:DNA-binding NarL/FixJ family response regulator
VPPIRVALVDDHPAMLAGTRAILAQEHDIEIVGVAADGAAALRLVDVRRPQVLVLDLRLPDVSGVEVARQVRASQPSVGIIVLTAHHDPANVRALARLGVNAYLNKTASTAQIVATIRSVAAGQSAAWTDGEALAALDDRTPALSQREQEVLALLCAGSRNADIAAALCITVKTVEYHMGRILWKVGARSRTEAVARARELGLLTTAAPPAPRSPPPSVGVIAA